MTPGFYDMPDAEYHADPWGPDNPSLSSSIARTVLSKSLANAWAQCPHSPAFEPVKPKAPWDFGKAVHSLVFGGEDIVIVKHDNFKTKAAQEIRDRAHKEGKMPILSKDMEGLEVCAEMLGRRFEQLYDGPYIPEQAMFWCADGQDGEPTGPRRCKMDTRGDGIPVIVDAKTTQASIAFEACEKRIQSDGLAIQAAAYIEALETLMPHWRGRVQFYFQWIEQKHPFALSEPIYLDGGLLEVGREQWHFAGRVWDEAMQTQDFTRLNRLPRKALPAVWWLQKWEDTKAHYLHLEESNNAA